MFGVKHVKTTAYHPQTNGNIERFNRTLEDMAAKFVNSRHDNWDVYLPQLLFAYRCAPHASTGLSPYRMMFGTEPRTPTESALIDTVLDTAPKTRYDIITNTADALINAQQIATDNIETAHARQKAQYDRRHTPTQLQPGQRVMLYTPRNVPGLSSKLLEHWSGPYTILERVGEQTYALKNENGNRYTGLVNIQRLKPLPD